MAPLNGPIFPTLHLGPTQFSGRAPSLRCSRSNWRAAQEPPSAFWPQVFDTLRPWMKVTWPKCILLFHKKKFLGFCTKFTAHLTQIVTNLYFFCSCSPWHDEEPSAPHVHRIRQFLGTAFLQLSRLDDRLWSDERTVLSILHLWVYTIVHSLTCFLILFVNFTIRLFTCLSLYQMIFSILSY